MIRTVITPHQQDIYIRVPKNFVGKEVEIIAFKINEKPNEKDADDFTVSEKSLSEEWLSEEDNRWDSLL